MIEYLLLINVFLALVSLYLSHHLSLKGTFERVMQVGLCFTIWHASSTLLWYYFFYERTYVDWAAPFALFYGPLFYFAYQGLSGRSVNRKTVLMHLSPYLLFLLGYIGVLLSPEFRAQHLKLYFYVLYSTATVSVLSYSLWGIFYKGYTVRQADFFRRRQLMTSFGISIAFLALIFLAYMSLRYKESIPAGKASITLPYLVMFIVQFAIFRYMVFRLSVQGVNGSWAEAEEASVIGPGNDNRNGPIRPDAAKPPVYQKSALSEALLDEYEKRLRQKVRKSILLDPALTLNKLASELKIPRHHLSQLFTQRIGQGFTQYINTQRIHYACRLLQEPKSEYSIEELILKTGFNSKSSFNRNFKAVVGCTPSAYREAKRFQNLQP